MGGHTPALFHPVPAAASSNFFKGGPRLTIAKHGNTLPSEKRCEGGKDLKERIDLYPFSEIVCRTLRHYSDPRSSMPFWHFPGRTGRGGQMLQSFF